GDGDRTSDPARRVSDVDRRHRRSGVSDRAVHSHDELRLGSASADCSVPVPGRRGNRAAAGHRAASPSGSKRVPRRVSRQVRHSAGSRAGWSGDDVSGVHAEADSEMSTAVRSCGPRFAAAVALAGVLGVARGGIAARTNQNLADAAVHVLHVQGNVYMLVGAGGNITLQVGDEGVLLVDTSLEQMSDKVVAPIRTVSDKPIRYIINTHAHTDHVGGNAPIAKQGSTIAGGNVGFGANTGAAILAHQSVLDRMSAPTGKPAPTPTAAWPTDTFITKKKELFSNGEAIEIIHQPAAHTDGDSLVFFRRSDVLSAGDVFGTVTYPVIDMERGGNIQGVVAALNAILDITIPKDK